MLLASSIFLFIFFLIKTQLYWFFKCDIIIYTGLRLFKGTFQTVYCKFFIIVYVKVFFTDTTLNPGKIKMGQVSF